MIPKNIKYHLYGHWHEGSSFIENNRYNCSILNDMYNIKDNFKPIVIDVNKDIVPIKEDEIPLPVTGDIIDDEQNLTDEDYELDTESN